MAATSLLTLLTAVWFILHDIIGINSKHFNPVPYDLVYNCSSHSTLFTVTNETAFLWKTLTYKKNDTPNTCKLYSIYTEIKASGKFCEIDIYCLDS